MQTENPYTPPNSAPPASFDYTEFEEAKTKRSQSFRVLAGTLAAGGILWGLFIFLLLAAGGFRPIGVVVAIPGYMATVGYIIRASVNPGLRIRYVIWTSSFLVQSCWLGFFVMGATASDVTIPFGVLCVSWWTFAAAASVVALVFDR